MLILGCTSAGVVLVCMLIFFFSLNKVDNSDASGQPGAERSVFTPIARIPDGVTISGIAVGKMTEQDAYKLLNDSLPQEPVSQKLVITYGNESCTLMPEEIGLKWDVQSAVEKAFNGIERDFSANIIFDKGIIRTKVSAFFDGFGGIYSPTSYWLEGDPPDLETKTGSLQTLVICPGSSGLLIFLDDVLDDVWDAIESGKYHVVIENAGEIKEPKGIDLESVFSQVAIAPINPDIDRKTLEMIPGKSGYGFEIEKTQILLEHASPGETIRVPMQYLEPTITEDDVWFLDTLGYCKTEYKENENRTENLRLACEKLNGLILQPGEILSYNQTLGQRTAAAGYKPAPAYSGTELINEIGGGICQVSSTLYLSSLLAELGIVERKNHGYPAEYIPMGLDATVNWGTTDLKIRNDYELPVKILAEVSEDGFVKVRIMGIEQRDYYVKMEYRIDDHPSYAAAYRCRYDKETGDEIYRKLDHTSIYLDEVWCWPGYAENATDE